MVFGRKRRSAATLTAEEVDETRRAYEAIAAPLRDDVRRHINPDWDVTFTYAADQWWFEIADSEGTNGSFTGSLIEVAVYVEEYLHETPRWPVCREHGQRVRVRADGKSSILWSCA